MLAMSTVIARLEAETDGIAVHGAASLAGARDDHRRDALYVYPLSEDAGENLQEHGALQRHRLRIGVLVAVTNRRDRGGAGALNETETWREAVRTALVGWTPPAGARPIAFARGAAIGLTDQTLLWQDEFEATYWRPA